jgi:hypothetical protein
METCESSSTIVENLLVLAAFFLLAFFFGIEVPLLHWKTEVGFALVDGQMFADVADFLGDLDAGCAGADLYSMGISKGEGGEGGGLGGYLQGRLACLGS